MSDRASAKTAADAALDLIQNGFVVGLGTGRAALSFVAALAKRVQDGLEVRGVPTSQATAEFASSRGIPLVALNDVEAIDVAVDGADEVDPQLNLIKGLGGALVREKIVAAAAGRLVILVGREKIVPVLGSRGTLPVEVVPFGMGLCRRRIAELGLSPRPREAEGGLFISDNGNYIVDCQTAAIWKPGELEQKLRAIPGVVATGLFLGMADTVFVQDADGVDVIRRK